MKWIFDTYSLDTVARDIPHHCHLLLLAQANGAADGLRFLQRVPLGLEDMNPGCNSQVQPVFQGLVLALVLVQSGMKRRFFGNLGWDLLPDRACAESHEQQVDL